MLRTKKTRFLGWEAITIENDYLRLTFVPQLGGRWVEFVSRKTGHNHLKIWPAAFAARKMDAYREFGGDEDSLCEDGRPRWPGDFWKKAYQASLEGTAGAVTLKLIGTGDKIGISRAYTLVDESPVISEKVRVTNLSDQRMMLGYSNHPVMQVGGRVSPRTVFVLPRGKALWEDPFSDRRLSSGRIGVQDCYTCQDGWIAIVNRETTEGIVLITEPEEILHCNVFQGKDLYTLVPHSYRRHIEPGEALEVNLRYLYVADTGVLFRAGDTMVNLRLKCMTAPFCTHADGWEILSKKSTDRLEISCKVHRLKNNARPPGIKIAGRLLEPGKKMSFSLAGKPLKVVVSAARPQYLVTVRKVTLQTWLEQRLHTPYPLGRSLRILNSRPACFPVRETAAEVTAALATMKKLLSRLEKQAIHPRDVTAAFLDLKYLSRFSEVTESTLFALNFKKRRPNQELIPEDFWTGTKTENLDYYHFYGGRLHWEAHDRLRYGEIFSSGFSHVSHIPQWVIEHQGVRERLEGVNRIDFSPWNICYHIRSKLLPDMDILLRVTAPYLDDCVMMELKLANKGPEHLAVKIHGLLGFLLSYWCPSDVMPVEDVIFDIRDDAVLARNIRQPHRMAVFSCNDTRTDYSVGMPEDVSLAHCFTSLVPGENNLLVSTDIGLESGTSRTLTYLLTYVASSFRKGFTPEKLLAEHQEQRTHLRELLKRNQRYYRKYLTRTTQVLTPSYEINRHDFWTKVFLKWIQWTNTQGQDDILWQAEARHPHGSNAYIWTELINFTIYANCGLFDDARKHLLTMAANQVYVGEKPLTYGLPGAIPAVLGGGNNWPKMVGGWVDYWNIPLYILDLAHYVRWTGDMAFLKKIWGSLKTACDLLAASDFDGDGLVETDGPTGLGDDESRGHKSAGTVNLMAGAAFLEAGRLAEYLGEHRLSEQWRERGRKIQWCLRVHFWSADTLKLAPRIGYPRQGICRRETGAACEPEFFFGYLGINPLGRYSQYRRAASTGQGVESSVYDGQRRDTAFTGFYSSLTHTETLRHITATLAQADSYEKYTEHILNYVKMSGAWQPDAMGYWMRWKDSRPIPDNQCCLAPQSVFLPYLVHAGLFGIQPDMLKRTVRIIPKFPDDWPYAQLKNLSFGKARFDIAYGHRKSTYHLRVITPAMAWATAGVDARANPEMEVGFRLPLKFAVKDIRLNGRLMTLRETNLEFNPQSINLVTRAPGARTISLRVTTGVCGLRIEAPGHLDTYLGRRHQVTVSLISEQVFSGTVRIVSTVYKCLSAETTLSLAPGERKSLSFSFDVTDNRWDYVFVVAQDEKSIVSHPIGIAVEVPHIRLKQEQEIISAGKPAVLKIISDKYLSLGRNLVAVGPARYPIKNIVVKWSSGRVQGKHLIEELKPNQSLRVSLGELPAGIQKVNVTVSVFDTVLFREELFFCVLQQSRVGQVLKIEPVPSLHSSAAKVPVEIPAAAIRRGKRLLGMDGRQVCAEEMGGRYLALVERNSSAPTYLFTGKTRQEVFRQPLVQVRRHGQSMSIDTPVYGVAVDSDLRLENLIVKKSRACVIENCIPEEGLTLTGIHQGRFFVELLGKSLGGKDRPAWRLLFAPDCIRLTIDKVPGDDFFVLKPSAGLKKVELGYDQKYRVKADWDYFLENQVPFNRLILCADSVFTYGWAGNYLSLTGAERSGVGIVVQTLNPCPQKFVFFPDGKVAVHRTWPWTTDPKYQGVHYYGKENVPVDYDRFTIFIVPQAGDTDVASQAMALKGENLFCRFHLASIS